MKAPERAKAILDRLEHSDVPISGTTLAGELSVSRQMIIKDIALLKEQGHDIIPTTKGYVMHKMPSPERVIKTVHSDSETQRELSLIVEAGGTVVNVFVWHKVYGKIEAPLNISTQNDVNEYIHSLKNGRSSPLKNVTNQYHYHLIKAQSSDDLDEIEKILDSCGFLVKDEC